MSQARCREVLASALATGVAADVKEIGNVHAELAVGDQIPMGHEGYDTGPTEDIIEGALLKLHRLHAQLGHPGNRAFAEILRRRKAPVWIQKAGANLKCAACERFKKRPMHPIASGRHSEPLDVLQMDGFDWIHTRPAHVPEGP